MSREKGRGRYPSMISISCQKKKICILKYVQHLHKSLKRGSTTKIFSKNSQSILFTIYIIYKNFIPSLKALGKRPSAHNRR